jgi:hypothetical protein
MPWLRGGTVAVTNGSTTVIGTNADFAANSRIGDAFIGPDGASYEIGNVASATVISIIPAYKGPTASGVAYAIMPVQGYPKALADSFNNINRQWGSKLEALGSTGNYEILPVEKGGTGATTSGGALASLGAAKSGANSDITSLSGLTTALSLAQGGTGGKSAAEVRTGLGLGSAAIAAILGTVSQSGGVPTGAIFESGSSSAGSWVKFASGLMITVQSLSLTPGWTSVTANRFAGPIIGNMPALFSAAPLLFVQVRDPSAAGRAAWCPLADATNGNTFSLFLASPSASTVTASVSFNIFAIGRWF